MARPRDVFGNFERMRREMDELFGDALERSTLAPRRREGFVPPVDVYYVDEPPRAMVEAELPGIDPETVELEIIGRELRIAGQRRRPEADGRVYQQIEIQHGPFRRTVELGADVMAEQARAIYEDGVLRIELPLTTPGQASRRVPIEHRRRTGAEP